MYLFWGFSAEFMPTFSCQLTRHTLNTYFKTINTPISNRILLIFLPGYEKKKFDTHTHLAAYFGVFTESYLAFFEYFSCETIITKFNLEKLFI
jgi:hypothetical protein